MLIFRTVTGAWCWWHCPFKRRWFLSKESHFCWEGKEYDGEGQHLSLLLCELAIVQGQCVDVWVSRCVSKRGCACVCVFLCTCVCECMWVSVCMCQCVNRCEWISVWMHVYVCGYVSVFMCMCVGVFVGSCVYVWERQRDCLSHPKQATWPCLTSLCCDEQSWSNQVKSFYLLNFFFLTGTVSALNLQEGFLKCDGRFFSVQEVGYLLRLQHREEGCSLTTE